MIEINFSIWLASKTRWSHLNKNISLPTVPRVGEYIKFKNEQLGDYFPWEITQIIHHETGTIEIWTGLLDNIDDRGYSFETEEEFDEYYESFISEGWVCEFGIKENTKFMNKDMPNQKMKADEK